MLRKKKRRKRRNNKKYLILIIFLLIMSTSFGAIKLYEYKFAPQQNKEENKIDEKLILDKTIQSILSYNLHEKINQTFLEWINQQYSLKTLDKINKSLIDLNYDISIWHELTDNSLYVLLDKYYQPQINKQKEITNPKSTKTTTLSFVGDVSLADNWYIMPKYDERNKKVYGILSEEVVDIMTSADIMVANNEFTVSNRGSKMPNKYYTFRGSPERLSIYEEMGVDLVTLANNHVYDFGEIAFYDLLDSLEDYNIPYIGAGRNITEAMEPYYFYINGYKIAFVNATRAEKYILTPEAKTNSGGVFRCYDPTNFINVISETKKSSDFVVALVHWGKEDSTDLEQVQLDTSKQYIEAGADIIVGTHAHILQGIDFYNDKPIIYNLGDFIFNNETKDTAIFQMQITDNGELKYQFIPCKEEDEYTYLLKDSEKTRVLNKIAKLSPNITFDENGYFHKK